MSARTFSRILGVVLFVSGLMLCGAEADNFFINVLVSLFGLFLFWLGATIIIKTGME